MGSMARGDRAERFIKEFEEDLTTRSEYKEGQTFILEAVYLDQDPTEEVRLFLRLRGSDGVSFAVSDDRHSYFDPEYSIDLDRAAELADNLGQPLEQVAKRIKKAKLD